VAKGGDESMVMWLEENLEIIEGKSSSNTAAKWLQVVGWKGEPGSQEESHDLDGSSLH